MVEYGVIVNPSASGWGSLGNLPDVVVWGVMGAGVVMLLGGLIGRGKGSGITTVLGVVLLVGGVVLARVNGLVSW